MKVIQGTLLYNKIECYNKGVQRSPSLTVKGCTHSSIHLHRSRFKMFRREQKKDPFFLHWIMSQSINVEPIECWLHHDAWCKHWRSLSLTENISISRGRNAEEHSNSTQPTGIGCNPSLNENLHYQKVIQRAWNFHRCHFWGKIGEGRIRDLTGDVLFPVTCKGTIPPPYPPPYLLWPWRSHDVAGSPCPIRPWWISIAAQIHLAHGWLPKCSSTEQADGSKYSPMSPVKMRKTDWDYQSL